MAADTTPSPLEKFVARATQLYTLPAVAMEVLQLTSCPNVDSAALTACIERDPALVGKILRTVNSSLYGSARNVSNLNQAIALLGIKPLKLLVLGFSLPPGLLSGIEQEYLARYWKSALVKAIAARDLAVRYERVDADDAFLLGLLQDIGMLALLKELGAPYVEFLQRAEAEQAELVMLELETLGFDHRLLSARMLQSWGLPESLWRPIAASTNAEASKPETRTGEAAEVLATAEGVALLITQQQPTALADIMRREGESDIAWWTQFAARIQEQVEQLALIFDVSAASDEQFAEIIRTAHEQLSQTAELAAAELIAQQPAVPWEETLDLEQAVRDFGAAAHENYKALRSSDAAAQPSARHNATGTMQADEEPILIDHVTKAVAFCRRRRRPLSLVLLTVDDFDDLVFQLGANTVARLAVDLCQRIEFYLDPNEQAIVTGEAEIALLLQCDRPSAVATTRRLLNEARAGNLLTKNADGAALSLSAGVASVALPAKNFPAEDLQEAARRCLYAVQASGGDSVKSIDIY